MIKGIIALFSSGLILAPQVLSGIIFGLLFSTKLKLEQIYSIYKNPAFYLLILIFISAYVFTFKKTYKNSRGDIDWNDNIMRIIGYCGMFLITNVLTISFVYTLFM